MTDTIRVLARAKVNLCLHVTGRRSDGYRLLDSLVVFPEIGDVLTIRAGPVLALDVSGPFAGALGQEPDNLVLRAARALRKDGTARIHLEKNLPVASGIGGGSADAAAALRALSDLWGVVADDEIALQLGADVPVCLRSRTVRMRGIGEDITPVAGLPEFWIVLVNNGRAVPTGAVFDAMTRDDHDALPHEVPAFGSVPDMAAWLRTQRNDMEAVACGIEPGIRDLLRVLGAQPGGLLARMSGSGGTCFGVFEGQSAAERCVERISEMHPGWWCVAAPVRAGSGDPGHDEIG